MQIVIDIDENVFTRLFGNGIEDYAIVNDDLFVIAKSIRKGTPLPKGHGDLIDRDDLLADSYPIDDWSGNEVNIVDVMSVKMADAIIEADRSENE